MIDEKIKKESENFSDMCTGSYESTAWAERGFIAGANWALENQWEEIKRDCDGFAKDENIGDAIIRKEDGTMYFNEYNEYIDDTNCEYYMPIPKFIRKHKR